MRQHCRGKERKMDEKMEIRKENLEKVSGGDSPAKIEPIESTRPGAPVPGNPNPTPDPNCPIPVITKVTAKCPNCGSERTYMMYIEEDGTHYFCRDCQTEFML